LQQIPVGVGYDWQDVVYTNALMMCSQNAASIQKEALKQNLSVEQLVKNSMGLLRECDAAALQARGDHRL
jgi:hypothetical protein